MKKLWTVLLAVVPPTLGAIGPYLWFRRRTRRKAAEARPKIEALLDEMIRIVTERRKPLDRLVGMNDVRIVNDERRNRDLSLHLGDDTYYLDVTVRLEGRKAGWASVSLSRHRGDNVLRVHWPDLAEYLPPEAWLTGRLERLDALVGEASRMRGLRKDLARHGIKDDDDDPPGTN